MEPQTATQKTEKWWRIAELDTAMAFWVVE
jgi:hypothetical protein